MSFVGWWLPALVTSAAFAWAALPRLADRQHAGEFAEAGQLFVDLMRGAIAAIVSLAAWLIWAVV